MSKSRFGRKRYMPIRLDLKEILIQEYERGQLLNKNSCSLNPESGRKYEGMA
ncbi:hypothetical protein [Halobacillus mangrovi]|uniref:hypothetical protein n=1 Tax=Halobacillus mangrovi TaxID=402384 RepID=UPI003D9529AD